MYKNNLKKAIIYDNSLHPERSNATFERIEEVLDNVLGDEAKGRITNLEKILGKTDMRAPLTEEQTEKIINNIDEMSFQPDILQEIIHQLRCSEISTEEAIDIHEKYNKEYRKPFGLENEDWVHFAEFNDIDSVKKIIDKTGAKIVILELVQGEEAGNRTANPKFVKDLWDLLSFGMIMQ